MRRIVLTLPRRLFMGARASKAMSLSGANKPARACPVIETGRALNEFSEFYANSNRDYPRALAEIKGGRKTSHWIWYIFPQLALHGHSQMALFYGLKSLPEAEAYLRDPVLGPRLVEITGVTVQWLRGGKKSIRELMGSSIDASKLLSCATVFSYASAGHESHELFVELRQRCEELLATQDTQSDEFCRSSLPSDSSEVTKG